MPTNRKSKTPCAKAGQLASFRVAAGKMLRLMRGRFPSGRQTQAASPCADKSAFGARGARQARRLAAEAAIRHAKVAWHRLYFPCEDHPRV